MKMRRIAAAGAVGAIATVGITGTAFATSHATTHATDHRGHLGTRIAEVERIAAAGALPASFRCASADRDLGLSQVAQHVLSTRLAAGETKEQAATTAGNTTLAAEIQAKIAKGDAFQGDLATVSSLITTTCPGSVASSTVRSHVEHRAAHRHKTVATVEQIAQTKTLPASFTCTNAARIQARITKAESRFDARIDRAKVAEHRATADGKTARATRIADAISKAQTFEGDLATVSSLIAAHCPA